MYYLCEGIYIKVPKSLRKSILHISMKDRLKAFLIIYMLYVLVFVLQKPAFVLCYHVLPEEGAVSAFFNIVLHGLKTRRVARRLSDGVACADASAVGVCKRSMAKDCLQSIFRHSIAADVGNFCCRFGLV